MHLVRNLKNRHIISLNHTSLNLVYSAHSYLPQGVVDHRKINVVTPLQQWAHIFEQTCNVQFHGVTYISYVQIIDYYQTAIRGLC